MPSLLLKLLSSGGNWDEERHLQIFKLRLLLLFVKLQNGSLVCHFDVQVILCQIIGGEVT
ncbi:hypothetical protein RchiOBHm_Chr7g0231681 [Rosa chinensis]|uniref:Uncharacterized protein n=1 Tax=Rosa chinensis TaxID=74649 RepID=A0A2P6PFQ0_ROSCH|nr:hypothetical protein RchiOBHm_Chr7g0231681 [Rosa chinensis]